MMLGPENCSKNLTNLSNLKESVNKYFRHPITFITDIVLSGLEEQHDVGSGIQVQEFSSVGSYGVDELDAHAGHSIVHDG